MALVSIYTVGRLNHPYDHPASREFFKVGNEVYRQANILGQLIEAFSPDGVPFSEEALKGDGFPILTLTVWKSLSILISFYIFRSA
ncbi:DUF3291 domain-containing protein [Neobacillus massiliamazoniensis]|uniref:DUF3291 domain-containing protein n=1 Tax=Neobacillus massiliamazoniensis TaxID=1499688 RepID=A0A0U1P3W5_9BACI|nr:hypothetical protein BN000_04873 [Neobacillus massiliamazoniensis]